MSITVLQESLARQEDLTTATTAALRGYPLGHRIRVYDDTYEMEKEYIYIYASSGQATAYAPYVIYLGSTTGTEVQTMTPAATALAATSAGLSGNITNICVPQITVTSGMYFFAQTKGRATAAVAASTAAAAAGTQMGIAVGTNAAGFSITTAYVPTRTQGSNTFAKIVTAAATSDATTATVILYGRVGIITT